MPIYRVAWRSRASSCPSTGPAIRLTCRWATTAQVRTPVAAAPLFESLPQIKTRKRALGTPRPGQLPQCIFVGQVRQPVGSLDRPADAEVPDRQHVRTPEVEHQEHVGAPAAEALDGRDLLGDVIVGQFMESL